ncbi:MAG: hypothetical protein IT454_09475 [Planctomycetes bacterium]|nr:hypothetical protein [Planctomycetota bacterium]
MRTRSRVSLVALLVAALLAAFFPELRGSFSTEPARAPLSSERSHDAARDSAGFRSEHALAEHFDKHGREFGEITRQRYLELACELRDARAGGEILEAVRDDGVTTRFDTRSGAFIAFNADRTIRTFFKPDDGRAYFERQLERGGSAR